MNQLSILNNKCPGCKRNLSSSDLKAKVCSLCGAEFSRKKRATAIVIASLVAVGAIFGDHKPIVKDPAKIAEAEKEKVDLKAAKIKTEAAEKAEAAARQESNQFEMDISLFCERRVKEKLAIPKSAKFDAGTERHTFKPSKDKKSMHAVLYEEFSYKNAFNAELSVAFVCVVDANDWKANKVLSLVDLKIGGVQ